MIIESLTLRNFRCFGPDPVYVDLDCDVVALVGGNGSGKTALLQAISRLFGVTAGQRRVVRGDFHLRPEQEELETGETLVIDAVLAFPELDGADDDAIAEAVPEFFLQMVASEADAPLKARMILQATWTNDGTPDGNVDEDLRWVQSLDDDYDWDDCRRVQAAERGSIQLVYVPATRNVQEQVTALLKGRLWQAAKWSDEFRQSSATASASIQEQFDGEGPGRFVLERLQRRWDQVHDADTDATPILRLVESRFEDFVRKASFALHPDEAGRERPLSDLSDGQRSLFHIALTAATLEVERDALTLAPEDSCFDQDKLRRAHLTILAIEEPENSLAPFFLSRIIGQAREIGALPTAQVVLSSHSAAILGRIEPEEIRYFRLDRAQRRSSIKMLTLPEDDAEASRYVRLAVQAYPELYFARFVVLGEGDSERLVLPRLAQALGVSLDPSFVPIVPLGGRYVLHFWRLLSDLEIPYATLLDFDYGRSHGGAEMVRSVVEKLEQIGRDLSDNMLVQNETIDLDGLDELEDGDLAADFVDNNWMQMLADESVFFSEPLDIDFAMLSAFPTAYMQPAPNGTGPGTSDGALANAKKATLKSGGSSDLYDDSYDDAFRWYPYLFLSRSKPEAHIAALSRLQQEELSDNMPPSLEALINHVRESLGLDEA